MSEKLHAPTINNVDAKADKEIALKLGEHIKNCRCADTLLQGLGLCKYCADEARRDCNFISNFLE